MSMQDEDIIKMCLDPKKIDLGFRHLMSKYKEKLYWQVRRIVDHHDDAEEVLQNVWIKIWQNIDKFKGNSALTTWMYRIAFNEALTYLNNKKKQNFADWEKMEPTLEDEQEDISTAEFEQENEAILKKIDEAVESLPAKQRLIFHYRYNDEMPYHQIAEITGTSEGALKASFHHAVKKIEKYVKKD